MIFGGVFLGHLVISVYLPLSFSVCVCVCVHVRVHLGQIAHLRGGGMGEQK